MNHKTKSAMLCFCECHVRLMAALHESLYLYGFIGMSATCVSYSIKLFNKYITVPVDHVVMGATGSKNLTKLRNLVAQVAQAAQIAKHQRDI